MEIDFKQPLGECGLKSQIGVYMTGVKEGLTNEQKNQFQRIFRRLERKRLHLDTAYKVCLGDTLALLLVDAQNNLRGKYKVEQADVNRMLMELDIVLMNENYGKTVSR